MTTLTDESGVLTFNTSGKRKERHPSSLVFSQWLSDHCPESDTGHMISDFDWIIYDFKLKILMLLEEKCYHREVKPWFTRFCKEILGPALAAQCRKMGIDYRGIHLVSFETNGPENGEIVFDGVKITRDELLLIAAFKERPEAVLERAIRRIDEAEVQAYADKLAAERRALLSRVVNSMT